MIEIQRKVSSAAENIPRRAPNRLQRTEQLCGQAMQHAQKRPLYERSSCWSVIR